MRSARQRTSWNCSAPTPAARARLDTALRAGAVGASLLLETGPGHVLAKAAAQSQVPAISLGAGSGADAALRRRRCSRPGRWRTRRKCSPAGRRGRSTSGATRCSSPARASPLRPAVRPYGTASVPAERRAPVTGPARVPAERHTPSAAPRRTPGPVWEPASVPAAAAPSGPAAEPSQVPAAATAQAAPPSSEAAATTPAHVAANLTGRAVAVTAAPHPGRTSAPAPVTPPRQRRSGCPNPASQRPSLTTALWSSPGSSLGNSPRSSPGLAATPRSCAPPMTLCHPETTGRGGCGQPRHNRSGSWSASFSAMIRRPDGRWRSPATRAALIRPRCAAGGA